MSNVENETDVISWQVGLTGSILSTGGTFLGTVVAESDLTTVLAAVLAAAVAGMCADSFAVGSSNVESEIDWKAVGVIFGIEGIYNFLVVFTIGMFLLFEKKYRQSRAQTRLPIRGLLSIIVAVITIGCFVSINAAFGSWLNWWVRAVVIVAVGVLIFGTIFVLERYAFNKFKN